MPDGGARFSSRLARRVGDQRAERPRGLDRVATAARPAPCAPSPTTRPARRSSVKDGCWATIRSKTARRCGSRPLGLGQLAVDDAVGGLAARVLRVRPLEVVHQQPAAGAQELLDQDHGEAVDRPVLRAVEVDEVEARLDVAVRVRALSTCSFSHHVYEEYSRTIVDPLGDAGLGQRPPPGGVVARARRSRRSSTFAPAAAMYAAPTPCAVPSSSTSLAPVRCDVVVDQPALRGRHERNARDRARHLRRSPACQAHSSMPLTLGTAGHIDHGKTALVGALTGVDTDRLPGGEGARDLDRAGLRAAGAAAGRVCRRGRARARAVRAHDGRGRDRASTCT